MPTVAGATDNSHPDFQGSFSQLLSTFIIKEGPQKKQ